MGYIDIQDAIVKKLKEINPLVDIFDEEIKSTEDRTEALYEYYFLMLLPVGNTTVSKERTEKSVFIDITYYHKTESNVLYLKKIEQLDTAFRPVFYFLDRAITIQKVEIKVVDYVLHYSFTLNYREEKKQESLPMMGALQMGV